MLYAIKCCIVTAIALREKGTQQHTTLGCQVHSPKSPEGEFLTLKFRSRNLTFPNPTVKPLLKSELIAPMLPENDKLHPTLLRYSGDLIAKGYCLYVEVYGDLAKDASISRDLKVRKRGF